MPGAGFFVSIEGIDGCGKTTQIGLLVERLAALGLPTQLAQEPGGTAIGRLIRSVLLDARNRGIEPMTELLLFFASRAQNLAEVVRPALDAGQVVVCDRFTDASVAYQGYGRGLGSAAVQELNRIACGDLQPDVTLWLDIEPAAALARARKRESGRSADRDRMESEALEFFLRVREGYAHMHAEQPQRIRRIAADGSVSEVSERVMAAVLAALKARGLVARGD
ncbi:MAG: dTMP kinase [Bryobacterales bacterium]|nr:dTMP kinase [Bryobacterales bacterium]